METVLHFTSRKNWKEIQELKELQGRTPYLDPLDNLASSKDPPA